MVIGKVYFRLKELKRRVSEGRMEATAAPGAIYAIKAKRNDGREASLRDYKGKVLLIVNTASECGYTPQYDGLQKLQDTYKDRGLAVLGFPCNQFGKQEPGSDAQIKEFCSTRFHLTFDLFSKIDVKGPEQHPLYRLLTKESGHNGDIPWNFAKFVVDREGRVAARFGPDTEPQSKTLTTLLERLLGGKP